MADNFPLNPAANGGKIARGEDIGGGITMPVSKIHTGADGVDGGSVVVGNPFFVGISFSGAQIDPRAIRALTLSDVVSAAQSGAWTVSLSAAADISDRGGRLLGHVTVDNASLAVTGTFWQATQPVSGTVTANIGTAGTLALDATLTGGTQKAIQRGGAKGATAAADVTSTAEGADHQAIDVQLYHGGSAKDPTQVRALTSADVVTANQGGTWTLGASSAVIGHVVVDTLPSIPTGSNTIGKVDQGAAGAAAWKVDGSAATQPISAVSLPLPTGAAQDATLTGGATKAKLWDGTNQATVRASQSLPAATDTALVVTLRDAAAVTAASLPLPAGAAQDATLTGGTAKTQLYDGGANSAYVGAKTGQLPTALGQGTSAQSLSVVVASDQAVPSAVRDGITTMPVSAGALLAQGNQQLALLTQIRDLLFALATTAGANMPASVANSMTATTGVTPVN